MCLILWGAEICLRPTVIILWCGVVVTVMMVVVVVVLRGRVVVMVVMVTLDVSISEEDGGGGRWRLLGRSDTCCQGPIALDGAVPTGCTQLRSCGEKAARQKEEEGKKWLMTVVIHLIYC